MCLLFKEILRFYISFSMDLIRDIYVSIINRQQPFISVRQIYQVHTKTIII